MHIYTITFPLLFFLLNTRPGVVYFVGFANNFDNTGGRNVHMSCHPADEDGLVL